MKLVFEKYHNIVFKCLLLCLIIASFQSCLKNDAIAPLSFASNNSAELLGYIESRGDYINSVYCPALISASELYMVQTDAVLLDIRDSLKFKRGHIRGTVNISQAGLISYLKKNNVSSDKRIIIISTNGQSASYCTAGLRILGYQNVFALKYGMASWNSVFADEWLKAITAKFTFNADFGPEGAKPPLKNLPSVNFTNSDLSPQDKLLDRVTTLLLDNYTDEIDFTITEDKVFFLNDWTAIRSWEGYFIMCYGNDSLYYNQYNPNYKNLGHIVGPYLYRTTPIYDLRSDEKLQSLPVNSPILIYSKDGHLSAELTMYLKVLGYDAKSILFGGNYLFYSVVGQYNAFSSISIMNYPYEKGN
jgi:rhodanese-related sulfurtransferase